MIDHVLLSASNASITRGFYEKALGPLGYQVLQEIPLEYTGGVVVIGMGTPDKPDFWLTEGPPNKPPLHIAFTADSRAKVDAFHQAALEAGAKDNGAPGLRPEYHKDYYGAFVLDPDGHNIEACTHSH